MYSIFCIYIYTQSRTCLFHIVLEEHKSIKKKIVGQLFPLSTKDPTPPPPEKKKKTKNIRQEWGPSGDFYHAWWKPSVPGVLPVSRGSTTTKISLMQNLCIFYICWTTILKDMCTYVYQYIYIYQYKYIYIYKHINIHLSYRYIDICPCSLSSW